MKLKARQAKLAHRRVAGFLLLFLAVHFLTHFTALGGYEAHSEALSWGRLFYQFPLVEIALVGALAAQIFLGVKLLGTIRKRRTKGAWHWIQFLSACYLAYFIIQHTAAALITRLGLGLDTNYYWAAGTLTLTPIKYYFAPYYTLAVSAIVAHVIAALHYRGPRKWHAPTLIIGPLIGVAFVIGYGGAFEAVELPQAYRNYYGFFPSVDP